MSLPCFVRNNWVQTSGSNRLLFPLDQILSLNWLNAINVEMHRLCSRTVVAVHCYCVVSDYTKFECLVRDSIFIGHELSFWLFRILFIRKFGSAFDYIAFVKWKTREIKWEYLDFKMWRQFCRHLRLLDFDLLFFSTFQNNGFLWRN